METISAASLVDMIIRLHPSHAPKLKIHVESLASGSMGVQAFCAAVRKDLGNDGTPVLLQALIALRSGKKSEILKMRGMRGLAEHAQTCDGACRDPGCGQINGMLQTIRAHCLECAAPLECATCIRWGLLVAAPAIPAPALPARAAPSLVVSSTSRAMPAAHKEATAALMMLARSALGDITDSPVGSPFNSPTASPKPTKRQKKEPTLPEASLLAKAVRCAPINERDARLVVTATTIAEKGARSAAPTPRWSVRNLEGGIYATRADDARQDEVPTRPPLGPPPPPPPAALAPAVAVGRGKGSRAHNLERTRLCDGTQVSTKAAVAAEEMLASKLALCQAMKCLTRLDAAHTLQAPSTLPHPPPQVLAAPPPLLAVPLPAGAPPAGAPTAYPPAGYYLFLGYPPAPPSYPPPPPVYAPAPPGLYAFAPSGLPPPPHGYPPPPPHG